MFIVLDIGNICLYLEMKIDRITHTGQHGYGRVRLRSGVAWNMVLVGRIYLECINVH